MESARSELCPHSKRYLECPVNPKKHCALQNGDFTHFLRGFILKSRVSAQPLEEKSGNYFAQVLKKCEIFSDVYKCFDVDINIDEFYITLKFLSGYFDTDLNRKEPRPPMNSRICRKLRAAKGVWQEKIQGIN